MPNLDDIAENLAPGLDGVGSFELATEDVPGIFTQTLRQGRITTQPQDVLGQAIDVADAYGDTAIGSTENCGYFPHHIPYEERRPTRCGNPVELARNHCVSG
jgi:hypothetical protein